MSDRKCVFEPDYAVMPGLTLQEAMDAQGLTQAELAERTQRPKKTINEIVKGKAAITPETAIQLGRVLGTDASFWIGLEHQYRAYLARKEELEKLASQTDFVSNFPIEEMARRNWIPRCASPVEKVETLLDYFRVATPEAWRNVWEDIRISTSFRRSEVYEADFGALTAWLRQGEIIGRKIDCEPFDVVKFRSVLEQARSMTKTSPSEFLLPLTKMCAEAGVALAVVREFPKLRTSGATRWLSSNKALLQLSLLYKRADQFWFSFFHEAGHIVLHGKREIFIDAKDTCIQQEEEEANRFAGDLLIPPHAYKDFAMRRNFTEAAIAAFAAAIDIDAGIVVGRLQHDQFIKFSERNQLRTYYKWSD